MSGDYRKNLELLAILFDAHAMIASLLQVESLKMLRQSHLPSELAHDLFLQRPSRVGLAVHDEDFLWRVLEIPQPAQDFGVVGVRRKLSQHFDLCTYVYELAVNLQLCCAFQQGASARAFRLVAHK